MRVREVTTKYWDKKEIVTSPSFGRVEKVNIKPNDKIAEWEPLFIIETEQGVLEKVVVSASGMVASVEVKKGDKVIPGLVLASINEEAFSCECHHQ
ncbi:biotin-dependent enzyme [Scopulibacillus darangshiensis]|uniref:Biotin-dependent enzyme n=1 Tax=Scopulibacillus darangshiensis TaxID=442528 RepID=A0A4R2P759_9BACL|nr:biotin/lipoyl-containing protein [Scopulibacillus darangshiensis]TCP30617.1 biotin-dependent enzyme [Scopulibacillus darangshiensis]